MPHERDRPVLRPARCPHPIRNLGEMRYAHTRQSLVGRTEQDPTRQHQIAATIALRPHLQRAVSSPPSSVWCNAPAGNKLHSHDPDRIPSYAAKRAQGAADQFAAVCRTSANGGPAVTARRHCATLPNSAIYRSRRRLRRRWPGISGGLCLGGRPPHAGPQPQKRLIQAAHTSVQVLRGPSPSLPIVQLAATASRSLPAVASHAIGFAEPRPGTRSHGSWHLRGERSRLEPQQSRWPQCRSRNHFPWKGVQGPSGESSFG